MNWRISAAEAIWTIRVYRYTASPSSMSELENMTRRKP